MSRNTTAKSHIPVRPHISVVIPVYNEMAGINETLHLIRERAHHPVEIVVADGGPDHGTLAVIDDPTVVAVKSPPGRGTQMNAGAAAAGGDILLFLHADTVLPDKWVDSVCGALAGRAVAGAFSLSIDSPNPWLGLVAFFANWRSRLERIPYGDQAQFMVADVFRELGGYGDMPIMEDVELFRRIRGRGLPIALLHARVVTSPRRWENEGILRRTLINWWLRIRYGFGAAPDSLAHHYRPHGPKADDT